MTPAERRPGPAAPLLRGLTWGGLALVALLYGIWTLQWVLTPARLLAGGWIELVAAWVALWPVILVGGVTLFIAVIVVLNAATWAGIDRAWTAVPAAIAGSIAASAVSGAAGTAPVGLDVAADGVAGALFWIDWAVAIAVGYLVLQRVEAARDHAHRMEFQRKALDSRRAEAHLRLLQAQIEPHFLFNTLSNIRRLWQQNAADARAMLVQLERYLRGALPKIRRDEVTLADEIDLTAAYLGLQKIRMGERLGISVDVPVALREASVPPMMLVTLAENAVKHGIAPLPEGGAIRISAARDGDALVLCVEDTGQGLRAASGSGVGLSNVRARLAALHGDRASLTLHTNTPRGLIATVSLPWRPHHERTDV